MSTPGTISIGDPLLRVDGRAKVTGTAKYSAEYAVPGLLYGKLVMSTSPAGRVRIDAGEAERLPGVVAVITPANAIRLPQGELRLILLQDNQVFYNNQPVVLVVAQSLEQAHHAAQLVKHPKLGRCRRPVGEGGGEGRPGIHDAGSSSQCDGAARDDRTVGWRPAYATRCDPAH